MTDPIETQKARRKGTTAQRVTKKARLIKLLGMKTGADIASLSERLGWQQHTTRAALTGLRKAGFTIDREVPGGGKPARYRIAADAVPAATASTARQSDGA